MERQNEVASERGKTTVGKLLNEVRIAITAAIEARIEGFRAEKEISSVANVDLSLPGTPHERGALHPLTQMLDRSIAVFPANGIRARRRPRRRDRMHCFDALNTPADHPARNEQDNILSAG